MNVVIVDINVTLFVRDGRLRVYQPAVNFFKCLIHLNNSEEVFHDTI